jgi:protein-S-isoprenylcysteine O-methyltransferase Ste14
MKIEWKLVWSFYLTLIIPLLYLTNIYLAYSLPGTINSSTFSILIGMLIATIGIIIWIISYIHLGRSFGVLPQKQKRVTTGIYKYLRHPMYLGIWLTFLGLSFSTGSKAGIIFLVIIISPLFALRIKLEEKAFKN